MSKFYIRFLTPLIFCFLFILFSKNTLAITSDATPAYRDENTNKVTVTFTGINASQVAVCLKHDGKCPADGIGFILKNVIGGSLSIDVCADGNTNLKEGTCGPSDYFWGGRTYDVWIYPTSPPLNDSCSGDACANPDDSLANNEFNVNHYYPIPSFQPSTPTPGTEFIFKLTGVKRPTNNQVRNSYDFETRDDKNNKIGSCSEQSWATIGGAFDGYFQKPCTLAEGTYFLTISGVTDHFVYYKIQIDVTPTGGKIIATVDPNNVDQNEAVVIPGLTTISGNGSNPCSTTGCETALGFIPTTVKGFTGKILSIAIGLAGGIALILMVIGSIRILASSGDPKAVGAGREMIVAAVAGLLFLIFATLILRFIGIKIIGI